jgi:hypothetical protein
MSVGARIAQACELITSRNTVMRGTDMAYGLVNKTPGRYERALRTAETGQKPDSDFFCN